jgi:transposase
MRAHNHETRQEAIRRWQAGEKKSQIARALDIDYNTLLIWINRFEAEGLPGLKPQYSSCGRKPTASEQVIEQAREFRKNHPDWGGGYIRLNLLRELPDEKIPGARQIQRVLSEAGLGVRRTRLPSVPADWVGEAFERVQVDAKERLRTKDGKECCYLNFIDEYTGAELDAFVFPLWAHQPSAGDRGVRLCAVCALALGVHPMFQGRQRSPFRRPDPSVADTSKPLPAGFGHSRETEPAPFAPQKRKSGTQPGNDRPLGRPRTLRGLPRPTASTEPGSDGSAGKLPDPDLQGQDPGGAVPQTFFQPQKVQPWRL